MLSELIIVGNGATVGQLVLLNLEYLVMNGRNVVLVLFTAWCQTGSYP